jgi:hypothetical protein
MESKQIKDKDRVKNFGEVYTHQREVNAMLDMIKDEIGNINSRVLEPSVGTGNFLIEILKRRLDIIENKCQNNQYKYEYYNFIAISTIYGVDIQEDNILECRQRLFKYFLNNYNYLFVEKVSQNFINSIRYILQENIIHSNTLEGNFFVPEWEFINNNVIRKDYKMLDIIKNPDNNIPIKVYSPIDFRNVFKLQNYKI